MGDWIFSVPNVRWRPPTLALVTEDATERVARSPIRELLVTDSVQIAAAKREALGDRLRCVSVFLLFAQAIRSVYEQTSISRFLD